MTPTECAYLLKSMCRLLGSSGEAPPNYAQKAHLAATVTAATAAMADARAGEGHASGSGRRDGCARLCARQAAEWPVRGVAWRVLLFFRILSHLPLRLQHAVVLYIQL